MLKKLAFCLLALISLPAAAQKRKVAIMDFGYATVRNSVQAYFGTEQDVGKGISDLLIKQLLEDGNYRIIERSAIDKIISEQNFSNSDRVDPATAARIGSLLGADTIIMGDITTFGKDDKHYGAAGAGGTWWDKAAAAGLGVDNNKTIVEISARLIDVNTAEVLASVDGRGETKKTGVAAGLADKTRTAAGVGLVSMTSSNFAETQIGKAVKLAVVQLAVNLDSKAATLPPPTLPRAPALPPLAGLVADVSGSEIVINVGTKNGVKLGDTLTVTHVDRVINDPATGKPLRNMESLLGTLSITTADSDSAIGRFTGTGTPKIGDHIKHPDGN